MKLPKYDEISILYHSCKANVVTNALSRKALSMASLASILVSERPLVWSIYYLVNLIERIDILDPKMVLIGVEA